MGDTMCYSNLFKGSVEGVQQSVSSKLLRIYDYLDDQHPIKQEVDEFSITDAISTMRSGKLPSLLALTYLKMNLLMYSPFDDLQHDSDLMPEYLGTTSEDTMHILDNFYVAHSATEGALNGTQEEEQGAALGGLSIDEFERGCAIGSALMEACSDNSNHDNTPGPS